MDRQGNYSVSEDQGEVSVLFCDIIDFDNIIHEEQKNVVKILDKLFRQMDELCEAYGI